MDNAEIQTAGPARMSHFAKGVACMDMTDHSASKAGNRNITPRAIGTRTDQINYRFKV